MLSIRSRPGVFQKALVGLFAAAASASSVFVMALFFALTALPAWAADTYTVTLPAGTEVTMQDPNAVLPFTVTNNSAGKDIRQITFTVDVTKYNISSSTLPPDGWCVSSVTAQTIVFALRQSSGACSNGSSASQIGPGGSKVFNITVWPLSAAADVAGDTLTTVTVDAQGGFSLSGSLPIWTRRALEASLEATPASLGTGGEITLTMQVTNRSTATQSNITTSPSPPSFSSAIVTNTAGPYYGSTALNGSHNSSTSTITVGSTTEFTASGTIRIDSEEICYTGKTATTLTGATRGCNSTTAASHSSGASVYSLDQFSLTSGQTRTIQWKYSADMTGSVYFTAAAANAAATARSKSLNSNTVIIGSFTATLAVTPSSVVSGQSVTVNMNAQNNGTSSLVNVTPSLLTACPAGATETIVSGPVPASIATIAGGSSGVFQWTYLITGTFGQGYCLSGSASATGPVVSNTSTSNTGTISTYSVALSPAVVASSSTNQTLAWSVYNGSGCTVRTVSIVTPAAGPDWSCASVGPPAGWTASCAGTVQFNSGGVGSDIPAGGTKTFSITFSSTETVTSDKVVSFPVTVTSRACGGSTDTISSAVTVSAYALTLTHSPAGPIDADGSSRYTMTAVLTSGGSFVSGKTVTFSTTNGSLDTSTAVTDINGQAQVDLVAPYSTTNTTATVTADYLNASDADTVSFNGWTKPNILYWGAVTPTSANCGSAVTFQVTVKNVGAASMNLSTNSYFAFNDFSAGGCSTYRAFLNTGSTGVIAAGATKTLSFGSLTNAGAGGGVTLPATFFAGAHKPVSDPTPPPYSGLFLTEVVPPAPGPGTNDQYRSVTDTITATGSCNSVKINIIEWRELR